MAHPETYEEYLKWQEHWQTVERPMWIAKIWDEIDLSKVPATVWQQFKQGLLNERGFYKILEESHPEVFYKPKTDTELLKSVLSKLENDRLWDMLLEYSDYAGDPWKKQIYTEIYYELCERGEAEYEQI